MRLVCSKFTSSSTIIKNYIKSFTHMTCLPSNSSSSCFFDMFSFVRRQFQIENWVKNKLQKLNLYKSRVLQISKESQGLLTANNTRHPHIHNQEPSSIIQLLLILLFIIRLDLWVSIWFNFYSFYFDIWLFCSYYGVVLFCCARVFSKTFQRLYSPPP